MFEYGFEKCGGCLGGLLFPWRSDKYVTKYSAKSDSTLNGYMDIDGDDPFSIDDERVALQANQNSYQDGKGGNYYRDNKPYFQKSTPGDDTTKHKKANAAPSGHPQKSTKSQKRATKHKPIRKEEADDDEFEKFLKDATQKSEDMKDDVQAYLQTTAEDNHSDVKNGVITSQPTISSTVKKDKSPPIIPNPSLLD